MNHQPLPLTIRDRPFVWGQRTYLMAVLNVTPDSFSDGGDFNTLETAVTHAKTLITAGADILDIGGQSTRPGALEVSLAEELNRVIPVVRSLRKDPTFATCPISIDTSRSPVAKAAIEAGADLVNDVTGGIGDPEMFSVVAALGVPFVLMHSRGTPETMQKLTDYQDLIGDITEFFTVQIQKAIAAGIQPHQIILDPGIGFAKTFEQNLDLIRNLSQFQKLGCPLLVGPSRKSFIGHLLNQPDPKQRVWGTAAACCAAIATGSTDILRIHDVAEMHDVCRVADAIYRPKT